MSRITLKQKILKRIEDGKAKREFAFLTREFSDLGGQDQVIRALRQLVASQRILKLGYGVYGPAEKSSLTGRSVYATDFETGARQVLTKLGIPWEPSSWTTAYNEGRSTQVPMNTVLRVKGRFRRKLSLGRQVLKQERGTPVL